MYIYRNDLKMIISGACLLNVSLYKEISSITFKVLQVSRNVLFYTIKKHKEVSETNATLENFLKHSK